MSRTHKQYIGSVAFYKHLIITTVILLIVIPCCLCVILFVRNKALSKEYMDISRKTAITEDRILQMDTELEAADN